MALLLFYTIPLNVSIVTSWHGPLDTLITTLYYALNTLITTLYYAPKCPHYCSMVWPLKYPRYYFIIYP